MPIHCATRLKIGASAAGIERTANLLRANQSPKYRPFGDLGMLEPEL